MKVYGVRKKENPQNPSGKVDEEHSAVCLCACISYLPAEVSIWLPVMKAFKSLLTDFVLFVFSFTFYSSLSM